MGSASFFVWFGSLLLLRRGKRSPELESPSPGFVRRSVVFADDAKIHKFPTNPRFCIRLQ